MKKQPYTWASTRIVTVNWLCEARESWFLHACLTSDTQLFFREVGHKIGGTREVSFKNTRVGPDQYVTHWCLQRCEGSLDTTFLRNAGPRYCSRLFPLGFAITRLRKLQQMSSVLVNVDANKPCLLGFLEALTG